MNKRFFQLAKRVSVHSDHTHKLGCVLVKKNRVVSVGFNKLKTHPKSPHLFRSTHAELSALLSSGLQSLSGCDIYVYRERKDGSLGCAKPCPTCTNMLKTLSLDNVYYSDVDGYKSVIL